MKIISIETMRRLEQEAIRAGITEKNLIHSASQGIAKILMRYFPIAEYSNHTFYFFCGGGNNGNDGRETAKILSEKGYKIHVINANEGAQDFEILAPCVLVDAILGIGARPGLAGNYLKHIQKFFLASKYPIVAIDVPTGITGDEAHVDPFAIKADITISCGFPKLTLFHDSVINHVGRIEVAPLPFPQSSTDWLEPFPEWIDASWVAERLIERSRDTHKYKCGHVHLFAGNVGTIGAAELMCQGALASGVGLVTLWVRPEIYSILATRLPPEIMVRPLQSLSDCISTVEERADSFGIGPGLGIDNWSESIVQHLLDLSIPSLFDADALTIIGHKKWLSHLSPQSIVTPHMGEIKSLLNFTDLSRIEMATAFCDSSRAVLLLKGPHTLVKQKDDPISISYNSTGNQGLAKAGTGDVLAGVCSGLLAQGYPTNAAARIAAYIHGAAADTLSNLHGIIGWTASDLARQIAREWRQLQFKKIY
ncbi:MAG: NAD(P)H-hydrate dehydratase [Methylacidiphilales bacterium]|nr:NAD(P)H-hydrate dehydratase [Candidatus Methylacidiphilales bacterium]MDW8348685.1 NAD(P)H-hydrate dehydratase [Verrucomicrobiae bacterium]